MSRSILCLGLLAWSSFSFAQAEGDAVEQRLDERIKVGRDWLRENRDGASSEEWLKRDNETWQIEKRRMEYRKCKANPESCQGS